MQAVLISIHPRWCELIASGKKTVEVRKTKPKLDVPFKCYIYCTNAKGRAYFTKGENGNYAPARLGNSKIIGEFVCDAIFPISCYYSDPTARGVYSEQPYTCLTDKEMIDYLGNGVEGYGWHISDLKIYDKPRELSEFCRYEECKKCGWLENGKCYKRAEQNKYNKHRVKRPPQSWMYVEVEG